MTPPILLVDAGNTRLKWGVWQGGGWRRKGAMPVGKAAGLAEAIAPDRPGMAWVSCVAGREVGAAIQSGLQRLGTRVMWVSPRAQGCGLTNLYDPPEALGADRYAMLVACLHLGLAPCVVVGAGTAVTVDALAGEGRFLGGLILPGLRLMREALARGTAGVQPRGGRCVDFPRNTADAVVSGSLRALAGAVEAQRRLFSERVGGTPAVILSGGEAAALARYLPEPKRVVEDLVLEGLVWMCRLAGACA